MAQGSEGWPQSLPRNAGWRWPRLHLLDLKPGDPYALNGLGAASGALVKKRMAESQSYGAAEALDSLLRKASPGDARSNPVFQRAEQLLASIRQEIRERGGPTNPELLSSAVIQGSFKSMPVSCSGAMRLNPAYMRHMSWRPEKDSPG